MSNKTKTFRLRILRRNIEAAKIAIANANSRAESCPIAQALKERGYANPSVGLGSWDNNQIGGKLCEDARTFVREFDSRAKVSPQRVTLTINY